MIYFNETNGIEYLKTIDMTFINEDFVKPLEGTRTQTVSIEASGHSKWFKIDEKTENK